MSYAIGLCWRNTHHFDNFRVYVLGDDTALCGDILEHLV